MRKQCGYHENAQFKKGTTFQEFNATFTSYLVKDDGKTDTPNNWLGYLKKDI